MRPLAELVRDAIKADEAGVSYMLINRAELRQLKDYGLVTGTEQHDVATFILGAGVRSNRETLIAPLNFQLHVREVLP